MFHNLPVALVAALMPLAFVAAPSRASAGGGELYKAKCASCHGEDGSGNTAVGRSLRLRALGSPEVQKQSDAELTSVTAKGKGRMPGYEAKLSQEQLQKLVRFIRGLKK